MVLVPNRPLIPRERRWRRLHSHPHMLLNCLILPRWTIDLGLHRRRSTFVRRLYFCIFDVSHWNVVIFTKPRADFRVIVAKCTGCLVKSDQVRPESISTSMLGLDRDPPVLESENEVASAVSRPPWYKTHPYLSCVPQQVRPPVERVKSRSSTHGNGVHRPSCHLVRLVESR
jgi:hypothetical protein